MIRGSYPKTWKPFPWVVATLLFLVADEAVAEVVAFVDGTRLTVQSYELRDRVLVIRTLDGKLQSIPLSYVDLETTERLNRADEPAPQARSSALTTEGEPRVASLRPAPPAAASTQPASMAAREAATVPPDPLPPAVPAQGAEPAAAAAMNTGTFPPAPLAPEVMARDSEGRITLRATRVAEPIILDGKLDDPAYSRVKALTGFIQQEPHEGEPATEQTEAWLFFDDNNFYIGARCWDSHPERMVANEMRRDNGNIPQNENLTMVLDTVYDRRNGFYFAVNPLGALRDQSVGDEGQSNNTDWNTVWDARAAIDDRGWTLEIAIPFKSLRFKSSGPQVWSFNLRRNVAWKNERSFLAPVAASHGPRGVYRFSDAATLVGVEVPGATRNLELKPYALSSLTTDQTAGVPFSNDPDADFGFDAKAGLTRGLIGDFTYNTDFAQVEEDQQEVNLTRFSLFFPEKREFFLEGQAIFAFGGVQQLGGGGSARPGAQTTDLTPIMFFSRRIGLTEEGGDPIRVGGRVTGRSGAYRIGALDIQTRGVEENPLIPATNFSVVRLRRDFLARSDIGVIGTYRNTSLTEGAASNSLFGVDGNFAFYQNLQMNTYYAITRTSFNEGGNIGDDQASYLGNVTYAADRYGVILEHLYVGEDFEPELGFLRREDFRRSFAQGRFSPRPQSIEAIRRFVFQGEIDYITDPVGRLETRTSQGLFRIEFENSDQAWVEYNNNFEFLPEEFEISDGVILPVGDYPFQDVRLVYVLGAQRFLPSTTTFRTGSFFDGDRTETTFNGRLELTRKFSIEPRLSFNWVDLPEGSFDTRLVSARLNYTFTPRMYVSSLIQYNSSSDSLSSSVRFRWEYEPGSDLFVVYSEGREGLSLDSFLANRTLAVKFTKLFRF